MVRQAANGRVDTSKKPYKAAVDDLIRSTEVKYADLDLKVFQLLDKLQQKERAVDGVKYLCQSLDGIERTRVLNWRAYVYTLLRKFDEVTYSEMKTSEEAAVKSRPTRHSDGGGVSAPTQFNVDAREFTPGVYWSGRLIGTTPRSFEPPPFEPPGAYPFCLPPADMVATPPPKHNPGEFSLDSSIKELPEALQLPELLQGPLPSLGSAGHSLGTCKPCAFLYTKGCANGENCEFCHLCDAEEKKRRKAQKRHAKIES
jgi:hypothetical protein